jgi:hypothetical protein
MHPEHVFAVLFYVIVFGSPLWIPWPLQLVGVLAGNSLKAREATVKDRAPISKSTHTVSRHGVPHIEVLHG